MARFELYRSGLLRREWRWRFRAANGRIVFASSEGYQRKVDAYASIDIAKRTRLEPVVEA